jgi:hypothetical protein
VPEKGSAPTTGFSRCTKENDYTRFLPENNHLEHERMSDDDLCEFVELNKGDAFNKFASSFMGKERIWLSICFMSRDWSIQEENPNFSVDIRKALVTRVSFCWGRSMPKALEIFLSPRGR